MTTEEKFKAIQERVPLLDETYTPQHVSVMIITGYLDTLAREGLLEMPHAVTPLGRSVIAVCEEFDWKPSDEDIEMYVSDLIPTEVQEEFRYFILQFRDNREELMDKIKKFKDGTEY